VIFRYVKIKTPDGELIRLPAIPIRLTCNKQHQDVYALIDSGAELCVFNTSMAKTLKIVVAKGDALSLSGLVGGSVPSYVHQLNLSMQGLPSVDLLVAFTETDDPGMPILGQRGFFDNFQIRFQRYKDLIEIFPKSTSA
jgi:Aspartyl protease